MQSRLPPLAARRDSRMATLHVNDMFPDRHIISIYCHACGAKIGAVRFCPKCGTLKAPDSTPPEDAAVRKQWFDREPPYLLPECSPEDCRRVLIPDWSYCPSCGLETPPIEPDLSIRCPQCRYR